MTNDEVAAAYRKYGPMILRRCHRALKSDAAAQDALQEVFFRLWRYGENFNTAESKAAWLYRIADRCCCDQLARLRRRPETDLQLVASTLEQPSSGHEMENRELVTRFLGPLDHRVRQIAVLHYVGGMTQEEVARATGWSRQTVFKKLLFIRERARLLRRTLFFAAVAAASS